jgi:hypothetical protein
MSVRVVALGFAVPRLYPQTLDAVAEDVADEEVGPLFRVGYALAKVPAEEAHDRMALVRV